ncbi:signal peptidase I [uncultured Amnibacterium sp.]|uniref:signal peptidase I n=1 Tax=uncultured Amnibacterium sp. TaxID=1631851 RepID=UPI0035CBE508
MTRWRSGWVALAIGSSARAVAGLLMALALATLVPAGLGWHDTVVMSGSMRPGLGVGDLIVSRPVSTADLRIGQVVLVDDPDRIGALRLHRLVDVTDGGGLVTRGDANPHADSSPAPISALRGVAALRVPLLGLPYLWATDHDTASMVAAATGLSVLIAGCFVFRPDPEGGGPGHLGRPARAGRAPAGAAMRLQPSAPSPRSSWS